MSFEVRELTTRIVVIGQFGVWENPDSTFTVGDANGRSMDITLSEFESLVAVLDAAWQEIWRQYKNIEPLSGHQFTKL